MRYSNALGGAAARSERSACIGVPGEHWVVLIAAAPAGPDALCAHPSAGAAEPSGLTHDTCIHVPARAEPAASSSATNVSATEAAVLIAAGGRWACGRCGS